MTDLGRIQELAASYRHQECLLVCQKVLQNDPDDAFAYKYAGKSLLALGQYERALQFLSKAHLLVTSDPEIIKDMGNIYNSQLNFEEASRYYNAALQINPNYAPAINNLGLIAKQKGNLQRAKFLVERARDLNPTYTPFHLSLSSIYNDLGEYDLAIASILKSLELKPDNPDAYLNLGGIYQRLGELDRALAATLRSIELKLNNPEAYFNLGGIYKDLGDLDQALIATLKTLELNPDNPVTHTSLGVIYQQLGQLDHALASTFRSIELKTDNFDAYINLGGIYKDLGDLDQALVFTLKALELNPGNPVASINLGVIYQELGQLDQALAATLSSLDSSPHNSAAHFNLAGIYLDLSDYANAEEQVDLAINLIHPKLDVCLRIKAACLFRRDKYIDAKLLLEKLMLDNSYSQKSVWKTEIALRSTTHALKLQVLKEHGTHLIESNQTVDHKSLIFTGFRSVEDKLIHELLSLISQQLSDADDARNGNGCCTDFLLLNNNSPAINQLSWDLMVIANELLSKNATSFNYDSFFNVFNTGSGTLPHNHLKRQDKDFNLCQHKYSLVYYLDPGDQECEFPGILKIYDPDIQILPVKGMIVIMPASRVHSSYYGGKKSRLMVGVNFYAFDSDIY